MELERYKFDDKFSELPSAMDEIMNNWVGLHENIIKKLLREILKREPIPEDAKELSFISMELLDDKKDVAYQMAKIGTIEYNFGNKDGRMGFTFYPTEHYAKLTAST